MLLHSCSPRSLERKEAFRPGFYTGERFTCDTRRHRRARIVRVHDGAAQSLATMSNRKRPPNEATAERIAAFSVPTVARAYSATYELHTVVDRIVNSQSPDLPGAEREEKRRVVWRGGVLVNTVEQW